MDTVTWPEVPKEMGAKAQQEMKELIPHVERAEKEQAMIEAPEKRQIFQQAIASYQATQSTTTPLTKQQEGEKAAYLVRLEKIKENDRKLRELLRIAFQESPVAAIKIAKELKNEFFEDTIHDALADYYNKNKQWIS